MMFFRVLARWVILEHIFAGPSEFRHTDFRRIIRSANPTLQVFEVVVERSLGISCVFALGILRLSTLALAAVRILFRSGG